ncbi:MAG: hypothetical protein ACFFDN_49840, partial [Candidatus Hodarchaeota archaeon]
GIIDACAEGGRSISNVTDNGITMASASTLTCAGTGTSGLVLSNLKYQAYSALSGTSINVVLDFDGTPYYFSVYPTAA